VRLEREFTEQGELATQIAAVAGIPATGEEQR
jgi:hypothetical protein